MLWFGDALSYLAPGWLNETLCQRSDSHFGLAAAFGLFPGRPVEVLARRRRRTPSPLWGRAGEGVALTPRIVGLSED
jgi:hypothetical protein